MFLPSLFILLSSSDQFGVAHDNKTMFRCPLGFFSKKKGTVFNKNQNDPLVVLCQNCFNQRYLRERGKKQGFHIALFTVDDLFLTT
jgi:hypothetical protein